MSTNFNKVIKMRKGSLLFILATLFLSLSAHSAFEEKGDEFNQLISIQEVALRSISPRNKVEKKIWNRYNNIFNDAKDFMTALVDLEEIRTKLSNDKIKNVEKSLSGGRNGYSQKKALNELENGAQVFTAFEGKWYGEWNQNNRTSYWEHHWQSTELNESVSSHLLQPVLIKSETNKKTIAINSFSIQTGVIIGAVGFNGKNEKRPCIGFYIDSRTIIWISLEKTGHRRPNYSFFYEWLDTKSDDYHIKGIGFSWDRKKRKITNVTNSSGIYRRQNHFSIY